MRPQLREVVQWQAEGRALEEGASNTSREARMLIQDWERRCNRVRSHSPRLFAYQSCAPGVIVEDGHRPGRALRRWNSDSTHW